MNGDPYCYDNGTLRNRFGITDAAELALVEHDHSAVRLAQLGRLTLPGGDDLIHLQGFHRHIFQDVYDWAGEIRTVDIAKASTASAPSATSKAPPPMSFEVSLMSAANSTKPRD